jgi:hypothetical protein
LKKTGDSRNWVDKMASLEQTNNALGLNKIRAFEQELLAKDK